MNTDEQSFLNDLDKKTIPTSDTFSVSCLYSVFEWDYEGEEVEYHENED